MNNIDSQYINLVKDVLENGHQKDDRTNTGTISIFGRQIRHKMSDGFPLLTTKKMHWPSIVTELIWFLRGDTNIKYLVDNGCNIWVGDCYQTYLNKKQGTNKDNHKTKVPNGAVLRPYTKEEFIEKIKTDNEFAKKWGDLGPIYGAQWKNWGGYTSYDHQQMDGTPGVEIKGIDQLKNVINELKTNPDSRRLIVSAWNVGELEKMVLPPCHFSWQCYSHEYDGKRYLSLSWYQRSCDVGLGLGFNIASYALLLEILAKEVNMIPYEIIGNLGDTHLYSDHIIPIQEQLDRTPLELPKLKIRDKQIEDISYYELDDFELINYKSHPRIKLPLSN